MTQSTVGSIYPFIKAQADRSSLPLSSLSGSFADSEEWRALARKKLFDLLLYRPDPCRPDPEVVERTDMGDHIREKVYFETAPDFRVPAYVLIPKNAELPAPGIIALHDHGGMYRWGKEKIVDVGPVHPVLAEFREQYYSGRCYATELARRGYVVIAIDAFYFGERRMMLDPPVDDATETREDVQAQNDLSRKEDTVAKTFFMAGITWPGVVVWDDIRTVDYLASRPEVDPERIGCIGLSLGGWRSVYLGGLDPRIKCGVVAGWMSTMGALLAEHTIKHTWMMYVPGQYQYLDVPDIASMLAPNSLLVIHGKQDALFPSDGVEEAFHKLTAVYTTLGCPDKFRASIYDTPHQFNAEMQEEAFAWLDSALGAGDQPHRGE